MPTYDYECDACGHTFDAFQNMSDAPLKKCPSCNKLKLRRLIGGGLGVIFKGSGFYVTDSKGGGAKVAAKGEANGTPESTTTGDKATGDKATGDSPSSSSAEKKSTPSTAKKETAGTTKTG